jgi:DNA topoisomerase-1
MDPAVTARTGEEPVRDAGPAASAADVGLTYVTDEAPGIARRRCGRGFRYLGPDGAAVRDAATLERIRALVLPPAWEDVWICPDTRGHLQATGRDARGRKVYRYHDRWREVRDRSKFEHQVEFAHALPAIRAAVERDLGRRALPRRRVLAAVVRLLDRSLIRVGNPEYARINGSYGATTMRARHAAVRGRRVLLDFRGKAGRRHSVEVDDRRLAAVVRRCQELPGQQLFAYIDREGEQRLVASDDVNDYLHEIAGEDTSAKDFRTWGASVLAFDALRRAPVPTSEAARKRAVAEIVRGVAADLGNTPAVCRASYIHPRIFDAYEMGELDQLDLPRATRRLTAAERGLLALLEAPAAVRGRARSGRIARAAAAK